MSERFNPVDAYCLSVFPELLEQFAEEDLRAASAIGSYIFHEDYFVDFVTSHASNESILRRAAGYIEHLAGHGDEDQRHLAEIGILESLVSKKDHRIAPFLGPAGTALVARILSHFAVDPNPWLNARKR